MATTASQTWFWDYIIWPKSVCQLRKENFRSRFDFHSAEEVILLWTKEIRINARVRIRAKDFNEAGELVYKIIQTTAGRYFNEVVPKQLDINDVLTKKT
jgi:hypothetical protein